MNDKGDESAFAVLFLAFFFDITRIYFYVGISLGGLTLDQSLLDRLTDGREDIWDVVVVLGWALNEGDIVLLGEGLAFLEADLSFGLLAVDFVANYDFAHGFRLGFIDLLDPVLEIIEGFSFGDWVDKYHSSGSFVVGFSDGLKPFLAGGIPDLHFDFDAIDIDGFDFKIDADGGHVGHFILLVDVAEEDVGLADCCVSDYHQLYQVVVFFLISALGHNDYSKTTEIMRFSFHHQSFKLEWHIFEWIFAIVRRDLSMIGISMEAARFGSIVSWWHSWCSLWLVILAVDICSCSRSSKVESYLRGCLLHRYWVFGERLCSFGSSIFYSFLFRIALRTLNLFWFLVCHCTLLLTFFAFTACLSNFSIVLYFIWLERVGFTMRHSSVLFFRFRDFSLPWIFPHGASLSNKQTLPDSEEVHQQNSESNWSWFLDK